MKQRTPVIINILIIFVLLYILFYMFVQSTDFLGSPYFWGTILISILISLIHYAIGDLIENQKFKKLTDAEKQEYLEGKKVPYLTQLYRSAFKKQTATEEKDMLIDHGFDGIMELDNQLPKWWLGLFYFGVAYCIIYITSYFMADFANPYQEYDTEYKEQLASIEAYEKTQPKITIETAVYSADNIEAGKEVFQSNCVSCHMDAGKGGIGPNLTDKFWINQPEKTLFKNVFHMVENGSQNHPTMQAFGKNGVLTGKDIQNVAAYIYHINQEQKPVTEAEGGAAPQGTEAHWEEQ